MIASGWANCFTFSLEIFNLRRDCHLFRDSHRIGLPLAVGIEVLYS